MPNASQRNAAQKSLSASKKAAATAAAAPAPAKVEAPAVEKPAAEPKGPSIRNTIMSMLEAGKSTTEISDVIKAQFPGSKAAEKPGKHISFYKSRMKREQGGAAEETK